jgi:hypothetical protein
MLARRPSLQAAHEFISEHDDALDKPSDKASAKVVKEFAHRLTVARETGNYAGLLIEGKEPVRFVLRPVDPLIVRRLFDDKEAGRVGLGEWWTLWLRCAVDDIIGGDFEVKHATDARYGNIAHPALLAQLPDVVINEIAAHVFNRAVAIAPKP